MEMFRGQTFLVIVASFVLVAVGQADAGWISIKPPSDKFRPITVDVGRIIQCTVHDTPYKSLKWYINDWRVVSDYSALNVTEKMRYWKQPITLTCKAYYGMGSQYNVAVSYSFRVANVSSGEVDNAANRVGDDGHFYNNETAVPVDNVVPKVAVDSAESRPAVKSIVARSLDDFGAIYRISFNPPSSSPNSIYYPTTLAVGTSIQCTAYGMDYPTYQWYDIYWNTLSHSSEVYVTEEMRHWKQPITLRCRAWKNWPSRELQDVYTFQVANASSGPEAWVIAVAVVVPIVGLAAIAIAVFFIIRCRKKKKMSTANTKPTSGSTAALLLQY